MSRSDSHYDVLLQGNAFCDLTFTFAQYDSLPLLGQEVFADGFAVNAGGIFNLASTLTRLGKRVGVVTQLGSDIFSRFIAERMQECGLSLELTSWVEEPLPVVSAGISFPHDRLFISYAAPRHRDLNPPSITPDDLDRYRPRVLFTFGEVGVELCREARRRGILVYVDAHWNLDHLRSTYLRELLQHVDVFSPNLPEALEITGAGSAEEALDLLSRLCRCVAIKCGSEGCLAWRDGERFVVPAIAVQAVETTGAGDNFNAGLIYGLLQGYSFERCLRCANIAGGRSTEVLGGCGSGVRAADLEAWSAAAIPPLAPERWRMKLTVIGTGVRTPLLMSALSRRERAIDLQEVMLVDLDERKLALIAPLCRYVQETVGGEFRLTWTTDSVEALSGAGAVIVTIRAGAEQARVLDERIALEHGVLGQETTGPGGFAMALRSIPAVAGYARQMQELCPDAWLLNFTNPAGLVAQGLTAWFPDLKIVGICDSPIGLQREVAAACRHSSGEVPICFFGLNHLSWMAEAWIDGENVVPRLIQDEQLAARVPHLSLFEPALLRLVGMLPNEYLYYYYYRERALANIQASEETRGEQIRRLSSELLRDLGEIDPASHPERAWTRYRRYLQSRHGTYMATETGGSMQRASHQEQEDRAEPSVEGGEGYAGVALDILGAAGAAETHASDRGAGARLVANVPNRGAVKGMRDDDVVEVVCRCDSAGLHPLPVGEVPEDALLLMQQVKRYERLTVEAVQTRSRLLAIEALMAHPLVGSYSLARSLVNAYLAAHQELVGDWP